MEDIECMVLDGVRIMIQIYFFNIGNRSIKFQAIKECYWSNPKMGYVLFCCDGAAAGNPGMAGFGIITRSYNCEVIGTVSGRLGITTNYIGETLAVIWAIEWAVRLHCSKIIIRSDSKTVVEDFIKGEVPWCFKTRWQKAFKALAEIHYERCYRELNFSADDLAKKGAKLQMGEVIQHVGRPANLIQVEMPNRRYYRFC
ncbi:uncharacterized protein LOC113312302 [Papaver somniferum]|uniref:uncharacterized protein LOC113312302 n=1 Tax=Papaver somniferum TaxID=3469 RepID=UPI000E6FAC7E|nr:uncharacterized protein LOC113312302 [Papaver somniferum]